ncbi:MAG: hypothetical protein ACJ746_15330 [Bryobacteraceae bacterium]
MRANLAQAVVSQQVRPASQEAVAVDRPAAVNPDRAAVHRDPWVAAPKVDPLAVARTAQAVQAEPRRKGNAIRAALVRIPRADRQDPARRSDSRSQ